jgi:hypothetical protein
MAGMATTLALIHSPLTSAAAWGFLPDVLRGLGHTVAVPEVVDDDEPPYASHFIARASQQLHLDAPGEPLLLVGHSGAGPLLPQIAFARQSSGTPVTGYVFLDAMLPRTMRAATRMDLLELDDPVFTAQLAQHLSDGGRFPEWTDLDLAEMVADPGDRALLLAGLRPRGLDFFTEPLPIPEDWPDAPCGYLRLSSPYDGAAHAAELRGWSVRRVDAHHFWAMTHPTELAKEITALIAEL